MMQRYSVHKIHNTSWGGDQWAIWDNELDTWADSLGRFLAYQPALRAARLPNLNHAVREQWRKYDAAVAAGKPHVAIVQINRKLVRLEHERDTMEVDRG